MTKWVLIAMGGALGSVLRYAMHVGVKNAVSTDFPLGTLAVNVTGCLLIGFLAAAFAGPLPVQEDYPLGLLVGVLGGFTTFSAFGWETFALITGGRYALAGLNVALSCGLGLIGVCAGVFAAKQWFGA
jgi:fluoride exporter